jgi:hypothetical protein
MKFCGGARQGLLPVDGRAVCGAWSRFEGFVESKISASAMGKQRSVIRGRA